MAKVKVYLGLAVWLDMIYGFMSICLCAGLTAGGKIK